MKGLCPALILALVLVLLCPAAAAADTGMYLAYTEPTARGTLCYLDICVGQPLCAATFDLSYDADKVMYRSACAGSDDGSVTAKADDGSVRIIYANNNGGDGAICHLSFKAIESGDCNFTLHMVRGVGSGLDYLTLPGEFTYSAHFGDEDIASDAASSDKTSSVKGSKSTSSSGSRSGSSALSSSGSKSKSKSAATGAAEDDDDMDHALSDEEQSAARYSGGDRAWLYILMGAGSVVLMLLLIGAGVLIGRRMKRPSNNTDSK